MSLTIEVANVGPIRHARLSLGKLNVLIGENDTGKTFFTTIIHRLYVAEREAYFPNGSSAETIPDNVVDFVEQIQAALGRDEVQPTGVELLIDDDMRAWAQEINESTLQRYGKAARRGIAYAYGLSIERLRRQPFSYSKYESYVYVENLNPLWRVTIPMDVDDDCTLTCPDPDNWIRRVFSYENIRQFLSNSLYTNPRWLIEKIDELTPRQRVRELCSRILYFIGDTILFRDWPTECLHLPSERGGIMQSYRAITSAALRKIPVAGIEPIEIEPLDGTSRDFLSFVISPESHNAGRRAREVFVDLASGIEGKLRAEIDITKSSTGVDQIVVITPEGQFQLNQSSSMISELSALLLALKHRVSVGDFLTIDEPEAHLHPEIQIEIAKLLVNLASAGLTINLTTHSDYFLEQINNAIRSRELSTDSHKEGLLLNSQISYDNVKALLFVRDSDGCAAINAKGDVIYPIKEDTFTIVSQHQYDESVPLINRLLERSNTTDKSAV